MSLSKNICLLYVLSVLSLIKTSYDYLTLSKKNIFVALCTTYQHSMCLNAGNTNITFFLTSFTFKVKRRLLTIPITPHAFQFRCMCAVFSSYILSIPPYIFHRMYVFILGNIKRLLHSDQHRRFYFLYSNSYFFFVILNDVSNLHHVTLFSFPFSAIDFVYNIMVGIPTNAHII